MNFEPATVTRDTAAIAAADVDDVVAVTPVDDHFLNGRREHVRTPCDQAVLVEHLDPTACRIRSHGDRVQYRCRNVERPIDQQRRHRQQHAWFRRLHLTNRRHVPATLSSTTSRHALSSQRRQPRLQRHDQAPCERRSQSIVKTKSITGHNRTVPGVRRLDAALRSVGMCVLIFVKPSFTPTALHQSHPSRISAVQRSTSLLQMMGGRRRVAALQG